MTVLEDGAVPSKKTASNKEAVLTGADQTPKPKSTRTRTTKPSSPSDAPKTKKPTKTTSTAEKAKNTPKKSNLKHIVTVSNGGNKGIYIDFLKIHVNSGKQLKLFGLNDLQLSSLEQFIKIASNAGHKLILNIEE